MTESSGVRTVRRLLQHVIPDYEPGAAIKFVRRCLRPARIRLALMRAEPGGARYGGLRGKSIDRRYIEEFLEEHRPLIHGRCLEIGDATYTRKYGERLVVVDVLDVDASNSSATIIGDLQNLSSVSDGSYDCVIVTQVLQYLQDPLVGIRELHRILAPGGSTLITVPTMAPIDFVDSDRWRFMPAGVSELFADAFGRGNFEVRGKGNLLTGMAYWTGLAQEDLPRRVWRFEDPTYPVTITVRATRATK